ncbi:hypothetical protein CUN14_12180 [Enterococcus faecium]|nr:hypothetical protein CUN14_12180 [Enterococcus faecium]
MYTNSFLLVGSGLFFFIINVVLLLKEYKLCLVNNKSKKYMIPNIVFLIASFALIILGLIYFFVIHSQL